MKKKNLLYLKTIYDTMVHLYRRECSKEIYAFQNYMDLPLFLPEKTENYFEWIIR